MSTKQDPHAGIFENRPEHFQQFNGIKVPSSELLELDYADKDIAYYWHRSVYREPAG